MDRTERSSRRMVLVLAVLLLGGSGLVPAQERALRTEAVAAAGAEAKDCGTTPAGRAAPGLAEPCMVNAFRSRQAAYWIAHEQRAIAVRSTGAVTMLSRATPSGVVREERCTDPAIVLLHGKERLRCRERYTAPEDAAELGLRVSSPVVPPRPRTPFSIPSRLCGTGTAGEKLQVELIVSATGEVRMADILAGPSRCDYEAVAALLAKHPFEPGQFQGKAVRTSWFTIIPVGQSRE